MLVRLLMWRRRRRLGLLALVGRLAVLIRLGLGIVLRAIAVPTGGRGHRRQGLG